MNEVKKNKTIIISGRYNWSMKVSVPETEIDELEKKFGVGNKQGTEQDCDIHNCNYTIPNEPPEHSSLDYFVQKLGGSMDCQNYDWETEIDGFYVEENK